MSGTDETRRTNFDDTDPTWRAVKPQQVREAGPTEYTRALDAFLDEGIFQAVRHQGCGGPTAADAVTGKLPTLPRGPSNDDVLYLGLNGKSTDAELKTLRAAAKIQSLEPAAGSSITRNGITYDLSTETGRKDFVATLQLTPKTAADVEKVLADAGALSRGNIATIAEVWARAENGGTIPSRMVVSGHSGAGTACGGGRGYVELAPLRALAKAMPAAARQIEDIHISACSSARNAGIDRKEWTDAFPELKTIWAYNGSAPSPADAHLGPWLAATQGRKSEIHLTADLKAGAVAVWSVDGHYEDGKGPIDERVARARQADRRFGGYVDGSHPVKSHDQADVTADYRLYRDLSASPALSESERSDYEAKANFLLRLRYYDVTSAAFANTHRREIDAGYAALGAKAPDFAKLSRAAAREEIARFKTLLDAQTPASPAATTLHTLLQRFAALDSRLIPEPL